MLYIFDIDGTLADLTHRLYLVRLPQPDWETFHKLCPDDVPIWEVITVARALAAAGHILVFSTGRMESNRAATDAWLRKYRVCLGNLFMRADGDHREDFVVKSELLEKIKRTFPEEKIGGAFEDRQQVVDMYRENGIRVFQVAKGAY
jgi:phosphoglycolate phosphatase-like HAD superfamily hydrolase